MHQNRPIVIQTATQENVDIYESIELKHLPLIRIQSLNFDTKVLNDNYDWLMFTSQNAVEQFEPYFNDVKFKYIASIGSKTTKKLNSFGLTVDYESEQFTQEGFLNDFDIQENTQVLFPASLKRRSVLEDRLRKMNVDVKAIDLYQPIANEFNINEVVELLETVKVAAVTFSSPSAVHALFKDSDHVDIQSLLDETFVVAIGPVTGKALQNYNVEYLTPSQHTNDSMMQLLLEKLRCNNGF